MNSTPRLSRICLLIRDYHFISLSMEPPALLQLRFLFSHQPFTSLVHQIIQPASAESWQSTEGTQQVKCAKVTSLLIPADISISLGECSGNLIWHIHTKWCLKIKAVNLSQVRDSLVFQMENSICGRPWMDEEGTAPGWAHLRGATPAQCDSGLFPHGFVPLPWMLCSMNYWLNLLLNVSYQKLVEQYLPQAGAWLQQCLGSGWDPR